MAAGYPEWMRDATGKVNRYVQAPQTAHPIPPEYPHPDAPLLTHWSGRGISPFWHRTIAEDAAIYHKATGRWPEDDDLPVSGDDTARLARLQCWDDYCYRTGATSRFGNEECGEPSCPHPRPHVASQWFTDDWPLYGHIAHTLYPGGVLPAPADPEPEPAPEPEPVQLDLLAYLETTS